MAKLLNFTVNTEFPAIAKTGTYTTSISQGSTTTAAHDWSITTKNITVASGDIICGMVEVNGIKFPTQNYARQIGSSGVFERVNISKINPTTVQVVMGIWNQTNSSVSHGSWSANVSINTFNVP